MKQRYIPEEMNPQLRTAETSELADKDARTLSRLTSLPCTG